METCDEQVSIGGGQVIPRHSQNAVERLPEAKDEVDLDAIWDNYRKRHKVGQK